MRTLKLSFRLLWGLLVVVVLVGLLGAEKRTLYVELEDGWKDVNPIGSQDAKRLRQESWEIFDHNFKNYMQHGFPQDDLRPISCSGSSPHGGIAITLLDVLDTLIVMNRGQDVLRAVDLIESNVRFDVDKRVSVFEVNIRALGGLVSAHNLILRNPDLEEQYTGELLEKAVDLADRLLPAFGTESGIPISWIHLRKGVLPKETKVACAAGGGTLILEFGSLSRSTGNPIYEEVAKKALKAIYHQRSDLGLVGNTISTASANWARKDSGIGPGIDSLYEYMLKAYLLFGDADYLNMFVDLYSSAMYHMMVPMLIDGFQWLMDVHMDEGYIVRPWISSLSAFWPGMQALIGQEEVAKGLHANFSAVFHNFGALPELFSIDGTLSHPLEKGYPLRPELMESTFLLYSATGDPHYLEVGQSLQSAIKSMDTKICGHAHVKDVSTGEMEDALESFFLSETMKYLYLLFSNSTSLVDFFIFSTEGHLLSPFPSKETEKWTAPDVFPSNCDSLCRDMDNALKVMMREEVASKFPLLKVRTQDMETLRQRRCMACIAITEQMKRMSGRDPEEHAMKLNVQWLLSSGGTSDQCMAGTQGNTPSQEQFETIGQVQCVVEFVGGVPQCKHVWPLEVTNESEYDSLPPLSVVVVLSRKMHRQGYVLVDASDKIHEIPVVFGAFGPKLQDPKEQAWKDATCASNMDEDEDEYEDEDLDPEEGGHQCGSAPDSPQACNSQLVQGRLVVGQPVDACNEIENAAIMDKAVALVRRGTCTFGEKVQNLERAGAAAVIIVNSEGTKETVVMQGDTKLPEPSIASAMASRDAGQNLMDFIDKDGKGPHVVLGKSKKSAILCLQGEMLAKVQDDMPLPSDSNQVDSNDDTSHLHIIVPQKTQKLIAKHVDKSNDMPTMIQSAFRKLLLDEKVLAELGVTTREASGGPP